jgi:sarcosine oxidase
MNAPTRHRGKVMSKTQADVIVLGLGAMGSAAAYHLAVRGRSVIGIDRYKPGHRFGSSHGHTRIIREAYFEAPEYVPLIRQAYTLWRELEQESGRKLLSQLGVLSIGHPDSEIVAGVIRSSALYGIACESFDHQQIAERYPGFNPADEMTGVFEPTGGILAPEACIDAYLTLARNHGATIQDGEHVRSWSTSASGVEVVTEHDTYRADRLVITAGPWAIDLLRDLRLPIEPWRVFFAHYDSVKRDLFTPDVCPITIWDTRKDGSYYIVPYLPSQGLKVGRHDSGTPVHPDTMKRTVDVDELRAQTEVIERLMPGGTGRVLEAETCIYTMTPDGHFIIDTHPEHENVSFATGFSGHGYKFASVIGAVMADLAEHGRTSHPIGFLASDRFDERR